MKVGLGWMALGTQVFSLTVSHMVGESALAGGHSVAVSPCHQDASGISGGTTLLHWPGIYLGLAAALIIASG